MADNYTKDTHSYGKDRVYDWMLNHTIERNKLHNQKTSFFTLSASEIKHERKMLPYCERIESWNTNQTHSEENYRLLRNMDVKGFVKTGESEEGIIYQNTKEKYSVEVKAYRGDMNFRTYKGLTTFFYDYCGLNKSLDGFLKACRRQKLMNEQGSIPAFYVTFAINGRSKGGSPEMVRQSYENFGISTVDNNNDALPKVFEAVKRVGESESGAKVTDAAYYHNNKSIVLTILFEYKKYARSMKFKDIRNFTDPNKLLMKKNSSSKIPTSNELVNEAEEQMKKVVFATIYDIAKSSGISATELSKAFRNPQAVAHHSPGFRKKLPQNIRSAGNLLTVASKLMDEVTIIQRQTRQFICERKSS